MNIEENYNYCYLIDIYGKLLTDNQLEIAKGFFFDNLGLTELSEIHKSSRQAIYEQLKRIKIILNQYEDKLQIKHKYLQTLALFDDDIKKDQYISIWEE